MLKGLYNLASVRLMHLGWSALTLSYPHIVTATLRCRRAGVTSGAVARPARTHLLGLFDLFNVSSLAPAVALTGHGEGKGSHIDTDARPLVLEAKE